MNHQEVFKNPFSVANTRLESSGLSPGNLFSGWPYFILILAALLMGSNKLASQGTSESTPRQIMIQHVMAGIENLSKQNTTNKVR